MSRSLPLAAYLPAFLFVLVGIWPASLVADPTHASRPCTTAPRYGWVSVEEVGARLEREGYRLLRLRVSNEACFLALVEKADGATYEMVLHPATNEQIEPMRRILGVPAKP